MSASGADTIKRAALLDRARLDQLTAWLEAEWLRRVRHGVSGRLVIEVVHDAGRCQRVRVEPGELLSAAAIDAAALARTLAADDPQTRGREWDALSDAQRETFTRAAAEWLGREVGA